jgi:hypothetical protein
VQNIKVQRYQQTPWQHNFTATISEFSATTEFSLTSATTVTIEIKQEEREKDIMFSSKKKTQEGKNSRP